MNLLKLLALNKPAPSGPLNVVHSETGAVIYLYDVIDKWWGVSAQSLATAFATAGNVNVSLHINSGGGDVFEARAMKAIIARHSKPVTAYIDGLAASAATAVCNACARVEMSADAQYMIHESWTYAMGNKNDMDRARQLFADVDEQIVNEYVKRTGQDREAIVDWMATETWFNAEKALANSFVDAVFETTNVKETKDWDLSVYKNAPKPSPKATPDNDSVAFSQTARNRLALLMSN